MVVHGPTEQEGMNIPDNIAVQGLVCKHFKGLHLVLATLTRCSSLGLHIKHCCDKVATTREDHHPGNFHALRAKDCKSFQQKFSREGPLPTFAVWLQQATPDKPACLACIACKTSCYTLCHAGDLFVDPDVDLHTTHHSYLAYSMMLTVPLLTATTFRPACKALCCLNIRPGAPVS